MKLLIRLLALAALAGTPLLAQTSRRQVSLADLAKAAHTENAVKVFTEDDLPHRHDVANLGDSTPLASKAQLQVAADKATSEAEQKKTSPAPTADELKGKIAEYQQEKSAWSDSAKNYQNKFENDHDEFRRKTYQEAIENDEHNAAYYQSKIDAAEAELEKAESNLYKEGDEIVQPQSAGAHHTSKP
jgi:xanthine dehydrogenase molybdopterin-binding subunit B